jgi:hypothetical protein
MPTCKFSFQCITDVLGFSDVELNIIGAKVLEDGSIEFEIEDTSNTLQSKDAVVTVNYHKRAVVRTLSTSHPTPNKPKPRQPIMLWYRYNGDTNSWDYNHYQDGHATELTRPEPVLPEHAKMWKNGKWGYALAYMEPGVVPRVVNKSELVPCQ